MAEPAPERLENLSQGNEYLVNGRGERLHMRSYVPEAAQDIKAIVIYSHGYGGHINTPPKHALGLAGKEKGARGRILCRQRRVVNGRGTKAQRLATVLFDIVGHGYSDGERAYVRKYTDWVDDHLQVVELVAAGGRGPGQHFLGVTDEQAERLTQVPFFLCGESLGGGLSILLGLTLQDNKHPLLPRFKGEVLLAPALKGNPPPAPLVALLRYLVVPLIPKTQLPNMLESVKRPELIWLTELDQKLNMRDAWGEPGGLSWGHNMRFRMGQNMLDLVALVHSRIREVAFPFLVMHDPEDGVVQFGPAKELTEVASTPSDDPRSRELKEMAGWRHDLLCNCTDIATGALTEWVLYHLGKPVPDSEIMPPVPVN